MPIVRRTRLFNNACFDASMCWLWSCGAGTQAVCTLWKLLFESASCPGHLHPRERPNTHCTGGWVGPEDGLDRCGKARPTGIRSPDLPAHSESLYRLRYPGSRFLVGTKNYSLLQNVQNDAGSHTFSYSVGIAFSSWG